MYYVEVVNNTNGQAKVEVSYLLGGKTITETSPPIDSKKIRRIDLDCKSELIKVNIFIILPDGKVKQIFHDAFKEARQSCYEITGTFKNPVCSKINCSSLPSVDWIYVKNKSQYARIRIEAIYIIDGKGYKDLSSDFKSNRGGSLVIPRNAGKVQFKVYMEDPHAPVETFDVIYVEYFYHPFNVCFEVNGVLPYPFCDKVPCPNCSNDNENKPPITSKPCCCCCCCCHCHKNSIFY